MVNTSVLPGFTTKSKTTVKPTAETEFRFTQKRVEQILPPKSGRDFYRDSETRGFNLMVMASGHKSFFWQRKVKNWPERKTLGVFPELTVEAAREAADRLNASLATWKANGWAGPSPFTRPAKLSLDMLVDHYVEQQIKPYSKRPEKAEYSLRWQIGKYLTSWKPREIGDIRFEDVLALHQRVGRKHPHTANDLVK
jgi:hypothetical protein